jgi:sterol desaturase/sphingolipid hydroxylase (fatty acid hydroxylase superfamily)
MTTTTLPDPGRELLRDRCIGEQPGWYSPLAHLVLPALFGLGVIALAIASLQELRPIELLTVPLVLVFANASEWRIHRDLLHKRNPIAPILYDRHTPVHHRVYTEQSMEIGDAREFRLVLLPAFAIVLILLAVLPIAALLGWLFSPNVALLFVATDIGYTLAYEWLHLAYHLPASSRIGRLELIRRLRRHHARHHDPRLMQRWNFNVTIPLWDWVRGTIAPPASAEAESGEWRSSS